MPQYINMDSRNLTLDGKAYGPLCEVDITEAQARGAVSRGARLAMRGESEAQTMRRLRGAAAAEPAKKEPAPQPEGIAAAGVRAALPLISECDDKDQIRVWIQEENQAQARSSVVSALQRRLAALSDGD